jgi:uncharacterized protein YbaR (Trm112 family)
MKRTLLKILACPACKHHPLELEAVVEDSAEVIEGSLLCGRCGNVYRIVDSIPEMIPPDH